MLFRVIPPSSPASKPLVARLLIAALALPAATLAVTASMISSRAPDAARSPAGVQLSRPLPVAIGDRIAGSFDDATGHSAQSHLVYAANARVWWLFTLTSNADSEGGATHIVKSFHSSGPDLATATWIAGADSPPAVAAAPNQFMGGGRALGVAYLNNSPVDVIHADVSMAFDGQDARTGHIRGVVTGTSITWSSWNYFDEPAATWTLPRGNTIGVSSGKFIHTGGPILQQEVDANARKSNNADTGSAWTSGFSVPVVIDGSMVNQNNALAFAPLANNVMLAVYDNGQNAEPAQTNLRYKRSEANGTWKGIVVGSQSGGDGDVFPSTAVINQNDWGLVSVSANQIYVFRRKASGSGIDAASYTAATNTWSAMSPAPPAFGAGQSFKAGGGLFGTTDGSSVWVCVINTDLANSILCTRFDGTAWSPWSIVSGTEIGIQNRNYISGSPRVGNSQIGLIWTEGTSLYDIVAYSFDAAPDLTAPVVALTTPASGATVTGTIAIAATATDNAGVAGVQFRLDGSNLGGEVTVAPYTTQWNTTSAANGAHELTAIARDEAGNTATAAAISVSVANAVTLTVPNVVGQTRAAATASIVAAGLTLGTVTTASSTDVPSGSVIAQSPTGGAQAAANSAVNLVVSSGPAPVSVPSVVGLTRDAAAAALANAGLVLGTVTSASSATVPSGAVISQIPEAAAQVDIGSAVSLVVSSGPPQVAVPDVVGLTQAAATTAIASAGLKVGAFTSSASTTVPSGSVISQTPAGGTQVASGTAVALVVSSGPLKVAVPTVVGLTQAAATTALINAGLVVGAVTTAPSTTVPAGSVISQTPPPDAQVPSGSAVALVVSSGVPQVTVPNVVGLTQIAAATALTNAGLIVGNVTTTSSISVPAGSVVSQMPAAGAQVDSRSAVAIVVSSGPPQVAVPNVTGLVQAAATIAITAAGLKVGAVATASSVTVPAGLVISQAPDAGVNVASGTAVALVVSSGPLKVAVPNVIGLTRAEAATAITNVGLVVGTVTNASSRAVPAGSVVSQNPPAGSGIPVTSPVDLIISTGPGSIGIDFVGNATPMSATEIAGLIPQANWNSAAGVAGTALPLVDETGAPTSASVTWSAAALWMTRILDLPGNPRLMKGYVNTSNTLATTVTVTDLPPRAYDVYVYVDGDNRTDLRSADYTISGPGITTTTTHLIDPINTDFETTFTRADNSPGNYVKFSVVASGFTITAKPVSSLAGTPRAPVNGIQIVPAAPKDFTITATPLAQTVAPGTSASYTATINALNVLSGTVGLSVSGVPAGTTATFTPATVSGTGDATLTIKTSSATPAGSWPLAIKATSGQVSQTATVMLVVAPSAIGIKFLGSNPASMADVDAAGVVLQTHWNNAAGAKSSTPLSLVDHSGTLTPVAISWAANNSWMTPIVDQPGNARLMKGYLDTSNTSVTTVTVAGLPSGAYDVYVYADGDNTTHNRMAAYQISGTGITTATISLADAPSTNFSGIFSEAAGTVGNYVKFRISGSGFTLTATPGTSSNLTLRAPLNGIQIVSAFPQ